ncbi:MAG: PqqD family protein [Actinomycetota bacterium]|nr:PqqD family protein [Actinomycetota bacterium]
MSPRRGGAKLDTRRPARKPRVWLHQAPGENALYDPDSGTVLLLNDTALAIWDLCDGDNLPREMIDAICTLCGLHEDVVTEDVGRVLAELDRAGLLDWRD